nr:LamA [Aspergillus nidulans]
MGSNYRYCEAKGSRRYHPRLWLPLRELKFR